MSKKKKAEPSGMANLLAKSAKQPKPVDVMEPMFRSELVRSLKRGFRLVKNLSTKLHVSESDLTETISHLEASGYMVLWDGPRVRIAKAVPSGPAKPFKDQSPLMDGEKVFGVISDTHICSHFERLGVVESAYAEFARLGITEVYHVGNLVDGHAPFNRFELYCHGVTDQANYFLDHYPQKPGMTTHFITGACHEGWWFTHEGIDFGRYLEMEARKRGRNDIHYLGFGEADVELVGPNGKSCIMSLMHPGGGTAYAMSYATQKIIGSLQGGEKPSVMLVGHYHKAIYHMVRNVHCLQAACCQDQTPFMRKRHLEAHVGFWTVRVRQDKNGVVRSFSPTFTNFFDRTYHVVMQA